MNKIYDAIKEYYASHEMAKSLISQAEVEKYLRRLSWAGAKEKRLSDFWECLRIVLDYAADHKFPAVEMMTSIDYQFVLWCEHLKSGKEKIRKSFVKTFVDELKAFYRDYFDISEDEYRLSPVYMLDMFWDSLHINGRFSYPRIDLEDECFSFLQDAINMENHELDSVNRSMDNILNDMGDYFHLPEFQADISRALMLYLGSDELRNRPEQDKVFSFWDYFFFDYRLIVHNMTPVNYYYQHQRQNKTAFERYAIRDLTKAEFSVFSVKLLMGDVALCTDLFTGKEFDIPVASLPGNDIVKNIYIGHIYGNGISMLNFIDFVPAGKRLRSRIKSEVMFQLERFKCQNTSATYETFAKIHNATIRHVIRILAGRKRIVAISERRLPELDVNDIDAGIDIDLDENAEEAMDMMEMIMVLQNFSMNSYNLGRKLFYKAYLSGYFDDAGDLMMAKVSALMLAFETINHEVRIDPIMVAQQCHITADELGTMIKDLFEQLDIWNEDPRYLTEHGFIEALYKSI